MCRKADGEFDATSEGRWNSRFWERNHHDTARVERREDWTWQKTREDRKKNQSDSNTRARQAAAFYLQRQPGDFCVYFFSCRILRPNKQIVWKQVTKHFERVLGDSDWRCENFTFLRERWSPAACVAVACLYCALLPLCTPTHKNTNAHIFFRGGVGKVFVVRYSSEQHFNDTDDWILQSGIIWGENFHFPHVCSSLQNDCWHESETAGRDGGWKDSHLRG